MDKLAATIYPARQLLLGIKGNDCPIPCAISSGFAGANIRLVAQVKNEQGVEGWMANPREFDGMDNCA
jgi:hypothetical protein